MRMSKTYKLYVILLLIGISPLLALPADAFALPSNRVKNITFEKQTIREIVNVYLEKLPEINFFVLHNPERIVVDIKDAFVPQVNISKETGGEITNKIRIGQNKKDTVRVVLEINKDLPYNFRTVQKMVNGRPAVRIMVSSHPKEAKSDLAPIVFLFDTRETKIKSPGKSVEPSLTKNPENSLTLFDDTISDDIFNKTGKQKKKSDFMLSGMLQIRTTLQTKKDDAIENNNSFRNRILVEGKYKNVVTLSALSDYLHFGREDETDEYDLDLYEAKWQYIEKNYGFSIGKQIIRWGKTDQISPIDTLNPQDLREFILPEYEERKIPIWMADLNLFFDQFNLEGVFIPFFEESRIDYFGTNWSIFGHMKKELQNASIPSPLKTYFENINVNEANPDKEAEFAARLTTEVRNIDMGFTFHHTTEDNPYFKSFPVKNIHVTGDLSSQNLGPSLADAILTDENIEVEYKRTNIAGFEFETIFADFGVRGEMVWQENESFLTSSLTSVRNPTFIYIVGADYTTKGNTYLNVQFAHKHISNYTSDIIYFDRNTYSLIGKISKDIISEWLEVNLKYSFTLNNNAWYLSPYFKYTYITNFQCLIGTQLFSGDTDTWFGKFKENDLFFLEVTYRF